MELTGNPFVDTGLMVLTALAEKDHVSALSIADVRAVFDDGRQLARDNQRLKCFTMVFGTNGPLMQAAYRKARKNEEIYLSIMRKVLDFAEREGHSGARCDLTGIPTSFNFHAACAKALRESGAPVPEKKWLGRDWVPLGGSLGNDAQALPGASRPLHVSAVALFALQYLPLGVFLFKGRLTCYQSTATGFTHALVSEVVSENQNRLSLGETEILGKAGGTRILLDFLIRHFESLQGVVRDQALPLGTELLLWLFSNSGAQPDCSIELVPESALSFVYDAKSGGFASELRQLLANEPKNPRSQLLECIRSGRDYSGLYSYKKWDGASPEFYEFYQQRIRGAAAAQLEIARKVSSAIVEANEKRLKEIRKPEFLSSSAGRNLVRKFITDNLTIGEYDALFPSQHHPVRVDSSGWQYLRYSLSRKENDSRPIRNVRPTMKTTHPKIVQIAEAYVQGKDPRKIKNLLDRMAQRKIGIRWLQDVFCSLAEEHKDWNLGTWDEFVCDDEGKIVSYELFFQLRLYLANLYREAISKQGVEVA